MHRSNQSNIELHGELFTWHVSECNDETSKICGYLMVGELGPFKVLQTDSG